MPVKNPGSASDKKIKWRMPFFLFLFSDPVHSHSSWQCSGHPGLESGGEDMYSPGGGAAFALQQTLILLLQIDVAVSFKAQLKNKEKGRNAEGSRQDPIWVVRKTQWKSFECCRKMAELTI